MVDYVLIQTKPNQTPPSAPSGGGGLPSGVTLQAIDGETMTSPTTMSNNYYGRNGFTYAANAGWDSPSFFPMGNSGGSISDSSLVSLYQQLNWNMHYVNGSAENFSLLGFNASPPLWVGANYDNGFLAGMGAETVILETFDEPSTFAEGITTPLGNCANSIQTGRPWWINNTNFWIANGGLSGDPSGNNAQDLAYLVTTPSGAGQTQRHIDIASIDMYFFSGSTGGMNSNLTGVWNLGGNQTAATADQCRRGFLYGDILDRMRSDQAANYPAPLLSYIETGGPYTQNTTGASYIQPAELNQAAWQGIIHGARGIVYFDYTFDGPGAGAPQGGIFTQGTYITSAANYPTGVTNPTGISMFTQITTTGALILALAPIINSPKAINYVTVNPASAEIQPLPLTGGNGGTTANGTAVFAGIDVRAMYYTGGSFTNKYNTTYGGGPTTLPNGFYIFASPRVSENTTNISATFTVNDPNATSVTVVGESRSISISGGNFTDTFASGLTVHIYQVNG